VAIQWDMPKPQVATYPVVPSASSQLEEAVQQAPEVKAEQEQKLATAQASTAQAKLAGEQAQDALLQRLVAPAQSNPALAQNPLWQRVVGDALQKRGLQLPQAEAGGVDLPALSQMLMPKKPFDLTPDQIAKDVLTQPKEARQALLSGYTNVPPELYTAQQIMNQAGQIAFGREFDRIYEKGVSGSMTPQELLAWTKANAARALDANIDVGALTSDPMVLQGLGKKVAADVQRLSALGPKYAADAAKALEDIRKARTVEELNTVRAKYVGAQTHFLSVREQGLITNAAANKERADKYAAKVTQDIADAQNGSWQARQRLMQQGIKDALDQITKANIDVRQLSIAIQQAKATGEDPGDQLINTYNEAVARRDGLQDILGQIKDPSTAATAIQSGLNRVPGAGSTQWSVPGASDAFDPSQAVYSQSKPWMAQQPDGSVWDTRAKPPVMIRAPKQ
jgi:hypothetical protein